MRIVILRPIEDGWWLAEVSSMSGCLFQGATRDEALNNIRAAIDLHLEGLEEDGRPIPDEE